MATNTLQGKVDLSSTDLGNTSESSVSFGTKARDIQEDRGHKNNNPLGFLDETGDTILRFSDRLAPKSDVPIMDRAKMAKAKKDLDTEGGNCDYSVLNTSDTCILDIARFVGIDLGASLDMVQYNLGLLRGQEQARVHLFENSRGNAIVQEQEVEESQFDAVDDVLLNLLKLNKVDCEMLGDKVNRLDIEKIQGSQTCPASVQVQVKTPMKTMLGRKRGRKKRV